MSRLYRKASESFRKTRSYKKFRPTAPIKISDLINKQAKRLGLETMYRLETIRRCWPHVAGEYVARHVVPIRLIRKSLRVAVSDSTWLNEMIYLHESLLLNLREHLGTDWIREIKSVVAEKTPHDLFPIQNNSNREIRAPVSEAILKRVEKITRTITDEQLNHRIHKAMVACLSRLEAQSKTAPKTGETLDSPSSHG